MSVKGGSNVRIDTDVLNEARVLADKSEMSLSELVSMAVRYALEHAKVATETKMVEVKTLVFK